MMCLIKRNITRYLRDPSAVFFSMISIFIVVGLYVFFLSDVQVKNMSEIMGTASNIKLLVNQWLLGGLLCIPSVSIPLMILCYRIDDFTKGILEDLLVTPVKFVSMVLGYVFSASCVGIIMTLTLLCLVKYICYL